MLKTFAGSNFLKAFNAWYYSFSPAISRFIAREEWARTLTRIMLYPLIIVLHISEKGYSTLHDSSPEVAVIISGFTASALLGLIYLTPPTTLMLRRVEAKNRRFGRSIVESLSLVWILSLILLAVSEFFKAALLCSVGAAVFVSSTIMMVGIGASVWITNRRADEELSIGSKRFKAGG